MCAYVSLVWVAYQLLECTSMVVIHWFTWLLWLVYYCTKLFPMMIEIKNMLDNFVTIYFQTNPLIFFRICVLWILCVHLKEGVFFLLLLLVVNSCISSDLHIWISYSEQQHHQRLMVDLLYWLELSIPLNAYFPSKHGQILMNFLI